MACPIQLSFTLDCKDSKGGIKEVYFAVFPSNGLSYSPTIASGNITAWASASSKFFKYEVRTAVATGGDKATISNTAGTAFWASSLGLQLEKMSAATVQELKNLMGNRLLAIVLDRNGKYWLMGYENGMDVTEIGGEFGTALGDFNGYKIALTSAESNPIYEVSAGIIAALKA